MKSKTIEASALKLVESIYLTFESDYVYAENSLQDNDFREGLLSKKMDNHNWHNRDIMVGEYRKLVKILAEKSIISEEYAKTLTDF